MARGKKHVHWVMVMMKSFLHLSCYCRNHPTKKVARDTNSSQVGSMMTTLANVQMSSTNRTMSTYQQEN
jgi:hypothetical protein